MGIGIYFANFCTKLLKKIKITKVTFHFSIF